MLGNNYYINVGPYIQELRKKNNITKSKLAEGICSVSYITRIENGERIPTSFILRQIAQKLGVTTEHLFRALESPTSLDVQKLLEDIFIYVSRSDMKGINQLIAAKENEFDNLSLHDMQIINVFKCISTHPKEITPEAKMRNMKKLLYTTYTEGNIPTDIEFVILFSLATAMHFMGKTKEGYEHLKSLEKYIDEICYFHTPVIIVAYYIALIKGCLETSHIKEASQYIESTIMFCKRNNVYSYLRQLYLLKAKLFDQMDNPIEYTIWYNKALMLHEMISENEDNFINHAHMLHNKDRVIK